MKNVWNRLFIFLVVAAVIALYGLGFSHPRVINGSNDKNYWTEVSADGWVIDGSRIILPRISSFGTKLILRWENRRSDRAAARLEIVNCSGAKQAITIPPGRMESALWLMGECKFSDPQLRINVLNPFVPKNFNDNRKLGVQLASVKITSPFKVPLYELTTLLSVFLFVYVLLELAWLAGGIIPSLITAVGSFLILYYNDSYLDLTRQYSLGIFFGSLLLGAVFSQHFSTKSKEGVCVGADKTPWHVSEIMLFTGIVILAATFRVWGLAFGLPDNYHPDEVPKVNAVGHMIATGKLDPNYFLHPSLLLYSSYAFSKLLALLPHPENFTTREFIILGGRLTSAIAGTAAVIFLALIGRNLFSKKAGLIAAAILAVLPLHITCSRYLKEDSLLVAMTLLTLYVVTEAVKRDNRKILWLASLCAGLSASSKYSGILNFILVLSSPWLKSGTLVPNMSWLVSATMSLIAMPIGFLIGTPYSIINTERFLLHFNSERLHMMKGHTVVVSPWSELWMFHFGKSILPGVTLFTGVLMTVACGFLLFEFTIPALLVVGLVGMYYGPAEFVNAKPPPQPERYILPCLPFMALAFGAFVTNVRASKKTVLVLSVLAFLVPAARSFHLAQDITYDTRAKMADYIVKNIPPGSKIYLDYPRYAPYLPAGRYHIDWLYASGLGSKIPVEALKTSGYDYMVLSSLTYGRYFMNDEINIAPLKAMFKNIFTKVPVILHIGAPSGTYGFNNPELTLFSLKDSEAFVELDKQVQDRIKGKIAQTNNDIRAPKLPKWYPY